MKDEISGQLPELPDSVETKLFLRGRDAWVFNWGLLNTKLPLESNEIVSLEVAVKLKKEFHNYMKIVHYKFLCNIKRQNDIYYSQVD